MNIRPMTIEDLRRVAEIEAATFSEPWSYDVFVGCLLQENYHMIVAVSDEDDSDILGYYCFYTVLDEGEIGNVCVRADVRRQGVASALMDYMIRSGRDMGLNVFFLEVRESNDAARTLYEKKGFEKIGLRKHFYTQPDESAVLMKLEIKGAADA